MKTLKTLLAVALLFSSVAPSFAMDEGQQPAVEVPAQAEPAADQVPVADEAPVAEQPSIFANVSAKASEVATAAKNIFIGANWKDAEKNTLNKGAIAQSAAMYAAIAAVVGGAGYALYNYIFADEDENRRSF